MFFSKENNQTACCSTRDPHRPFDFFLRKEHIITTFGGLYIFKSEW